MSTQASDSPRTDGEYRSNATVEQVAARLASARRVLLTTHVKPDGDAIGSTLALARAMQPRGVESQILLMGPLEERLKTIAGDTPYLRHDGPPPRDDHDAIVIVDTGAWAQLEPIADWLRPRRDRVIGIDHHARGDDVAAMRLIDVTCASTTQLLVPVLEAMGCEITGGTGGVAEALFIGLATDTGWFRYSNADARALGLAARLMALDVDKSRLYQLIEETFRPQRLALLARALASLEFAAGGSAAIMSLRAEDFGETGGVVQDVSEMVNTPLSVQNVRVAVMIVQHGPGRCKLSLRSKPDVPGTPNHAPIDMNALAHRFGGGGHVHAAGATIAMDVDGARRAVIEALEGSELE